MRNCCRSLTQQLVIFLESPTQFFLLSLGISLAFTGSKLVRLSKVYIPVWSLSVIMLVVFLLNDVSQIPGRTFLQWGLYFSSGNLGFIIGYALLQIIFQKLIPIIIHFSNIQSLIFLITTIVLEIILIRAMLTPTEKCKLCPKKCVNLRNVVTTIFA
jgi:hypothetical protein